MITPQDDDSLHSQVQDVLYWGAVGLATLLTLAAAVGLCSYLYHRWF